MIAYSCYFTNTGEVRRINEDSLLVNELLVSEADMEEVKLLKMEGDNLIYAVADGMGGHRKGEVASRTVLDIFRGRNKYIEGRGQILDSMLLAREGLNHIVEGERGSLGLGTTVSGVLFDKGKLIVFNCGDSRVYRKRDRVLEKITKDHSLVQELVDEGVITEENMRSHPKKNIVTSAIIGDLGRHLPKISVEETETMPGDRFLLCTDGVWESMSRAEMEKCFEIEDPEEIMRCLFGKVLESGARDNLSMIIVEVID